MSNFNSGAQGAITNKAYSQLEKIYAEVDAFINLVGLEYDFDDSEFYCTNKDQVDDEWCDEDLLQDLDHLHSDLGYFLGK